ncbi:MAG: hypothetical protein RMJ56_06975 [Gemmataceae bacterium]|nr:hypothetical protein [Gemmata sp.]MDW8197332.1 hypothetical protein [Gemmataceae bacterium]
MAKAKAKTQESVVAEDPRRPTPVRRDGPYVLMLFVTLLAIITGTVLMYLDTEEYGGKSPPKETAPEARPLGGLPKANPNP